MANLATINQEFARLDSALRSGRLDVAQFRAERRRVLLDFDERTSTTLPGVTTGGETTLVDPPIELPASPTKSLSAAEEMPTTKGRLPSGLLLTAVAGLIAAAFFAWWLIGQSSSPKPEATQTVPIATELPQDVAAALMQTSWSAVDVDAFLRRWQRLPPATIHAARDDPRIWLLRGEADRRLRDARDAESVDPTDESKARTQKLEQILEAIRTP